MAMAETLRSDAQDDDSRRAGGSKRGRSKRATVLWLAIAAIAAIVLTTESFLFREARRLQGDLDHVVRSAERSTYLIGDIGLRLSRLQANALEALTEDPAETAVIVGRCERIGSLLRARAHELPEHLSSEENQLWNAIAPSVERFHRTLNRALQLAIENRRSEAELELDLIASQSRRVLDELQTLQDLNQRQTQTLLAEAGQLLVRNQLVQVLLAGVLLAAIIGIVLTAQRVLRRKDRELTRHVARVEQANDDLDAFAGRVAHDIRNVLAPLHTASKLLELSAHEPKVVSDVTGVVERTSRRAGDLLSGLLAFSRAGAPPSFALVRVDEALKVVLEEQIEEARRVEADIRVDVQPLLSVRCEPALLHIVLLNLLSNAFKFLEGRPLRRVEVSARAVGDRCHVEIRDTGPGIPAAALEHIFEPFFRVPGSSVPGSGIGLATVHRIVVAHGWKLEVNSVVGEGSTFRVLMPVAALSMDGLLRSDVQAALATTRRE